MQSREARLQEFVEWCSAHVTGDEKGRAQIFLDRLFQAFGQKGSLDVGGTAADGYGHGEARPGSTALAVSASFENPAKLVAED